MRSVQDLLNESFTTYVSSGDASDTSISDTAAAAAAGNNNNNNNQQQSSADWAVLQAILDEDAPDEEEDDVSVTLNKIVATDALLSKSLSLDESFFNDDDEDDDSEGDAALIGHSGNRDLVDAILEAMSDDDEEEEDEDEHELDISFERYNKKTTDNKVYKVTVDTLDNESGVVEGGKYSRSVSEILVESDSTDNSDVFDRQFKSLPALQNTVEHDRPFFIPSTVKSVKCHNFEENLEQLPENDTTSPSQQRVSLLHLAESHEQKTLLQHTVDQELVNPLNVKRKMKPKIELITRKTKRHIKGHSSSMFNFVANADLDTNEVSTISSGSHFGQKLPKYNFSGIMEGKVMNKITKELVQNSRARKVAVGLPTALAVNSKFIAIGTQRGVIIVFDLFEEVRQQLGKSAGASSGSVTSLDLSPDSEFLISGYTSGYIVFWDIIKGTILKTVHDLHSAPVTLVRFYSTSSSVVCVDAGGLVNKVNFSKSTLWTNYSADAECLLDGTAGQVLAMQVLPPVSTLKLSVDAARRNPGRRLSLIALSSERSSFVVAVDPIVNVLHRWPKVDGASTDCLPCLAFGWAVISGGGSSLTPVLARGWGTKLQLLQANFPEGAENADSSEILWPAFGIYDEFETSSNVISMDWLGDRTLTYMTETNEFVVIDTVMMHMLERLNFSGMRLVYAEFALSKSVTAKAGPTSRTFLNSIRSFDKRLLILCQEQLKSISIFGTKQRIAALEEDGEWLEALALALDMYEGEIKSLEDAKRPETGDLSTHPEFSKSSGLSESEAWLSRLLMRYVKLAIDNAPGGSHFELTHSHFQMLAGVCIEFCVVTRRLDLLYGEVFRRFQETNSTSIFLDVLEPYILHDRLTYVAPEVMAHFIQLCSVKNEIFIVERALLHMDVTIMDFDSTLTMLKRNKMYSALIHIYTQGLDDYITPLEILFEEAFDASDLYEHRMSSNVKSFSKLNPFEKYGYKSLLYINYCLQNKTFPQGKMLPEGRGQTARAEILKLLSKEAYAASTKKRGIVGRRTRSYPYMSLLVAVDAKAVLDILSLALDSEDAVFADSSYEMMHSGGFEVEVDMNTLEAPTKGSSKVIDDRSNAVNVKNIQSSREKQDDVLLPDRQLLVGILSSVIQTDPKGKSSSMDAFLDFMAKYIVRGVVRAPASLTFNVVSRMCRLPSADVCSRHEAEEKVIALLSSLSPNSYDRQEVLTLTESVSMNRASLVLHKSASCDLSIKPSDRQKHFGSAMDCFLDDEDKNFHPGVFTYIRNENMRSGHVKVSDNDQGFKFTVYKKLPRLIKVDAALTVQLIAELYPDDIRGVLRALVTDEVMAYKLLESIFSGAASKEDSVIIQLAAVVEKEHTQTYLLLMAKFNPENVYDFLSSSNNYNLEESLKLCQEHDIADASAYLLERSGSIQGALQLLLRTIEAKLIYLKSIIWSMGKSEKFRKASTEKKLALSKKDAEVDALKQILDVALDVCERNTESHDIRGPQLWFNVLDRLINAKVFLRISNELPHHCQILSEILSDLVQLTMQRMVSCVPLNYLVTKLTNDYNGNRLNEFREMILSLLQTFNHELEVYVSAADLMHSDLSDMSNERLRMKMSALRVSSLQNKPLCPYSNKKRLHQLSFDSTQYNSVDVNSKGEAKLSRHEFGNHVDLDNCNEQHNIESQVTNTVSKLRMSWTTCQTSTRGKGTATKSSLDKMPLSEQNHRMFGVSSDDDGPIYRQVGMLSEPLNMGGLNFVK